jgi:glucan phosphoethanolaminetransferase (alkaline phosphatase superfamily)
MKGHCTITQMCENLWITEDNASRSKHVAWWRIIYGILITLWLLMLKADKYNSSAQVLLRKVRSVATFCVIMSLHFFSQCLWDVDWSIPSYFHIPWTYNAFLLDITTQNRMYIHLQPNSLYCLHMNTAYWHKAALPSLHRYFIYICS